MPRIARVAPGGVVYHVLNRGNGRRMIFHKDADNRAFVDLMAEVKRRVPGRTPHRSRGTFETPSLPG